MDDDFDGQEVRVVDVEGKKEGVPESLTMSKRKRKREKDKERRAKKLKGEDGSSTKVNGEKENGDVVMKDAGTETTKKDSPEGKENADKDAKGKDTKDGKPKKQFNGKKKDFHKKRKDGKAFSKSKDGKPSNSSKPKAKAPKPLVEDDVNPDIALLDPSLTSDFILQRLRTSRPNLSPIELTDLTPSASSIADTSSFTQPRTLANLSAFLESLASKAALSSSPDDKGSPHTIILSGSAVRCTHVKRAVQSFQSPSSLIAKLFAKHLKLSENVSFLDSSRTGIAVGTPRRVLDLVRDGALKLAALERVVVDASRKDKKGFGIWEVRETQADLVELLNEKAVKERMAEGKTKLVFY